MKQALFILTAFLLLAPSILMGQDFEVVSPVGNLLKVDEFGNQSNVTDTSISLRNITSSTLTISISIPWSNGWTTSQGSSVTLAPFETKAISVKATTKDFGVFRSKIIFADGITTTPVLLEATIIPNLIDSLLAAHSSRVSFYDREIPVGTTHCVPLVAMNNSSKAINIYGFNLQKEPGLTLDTVAFLPYVILPGEKIIIANLCYKANTANQEIYTRNGFTSSLTYEGSGSLTFDYVIRTVTDTILSKPCLEISQGNNLIGPVLFGGDTTQTLFFKSNRYDTTFVNDVVFYGGDGLMFKMVKPLPDTILPLSLTPVKVRFSPTTLLQVVKDRFAVDARFTTSCGNFSIDLSALAMQPTADSISTPLFPDKEYVLGMSSSAASFSQDFHFVNNGLTNTKILSVGLADPSPEFVVTNITPTNTLPFTLLPGEKMTVSVLFTPSQVGKVFFNQLLITTEQGIQSVSYPLQGLRTTTSGVQGSSDPSVSVTLNPNPATTSVTVSVKGAGVIEEASMSNTIGNMVLVNYKPAKPEWTWELKPDFIMRGVYFIRINGKTPDGKPFVASRRLVVE